MGNGGVPTGGASAGGTTSGNGGTMSGAAGNGGTTSGGAGNGGNGGATSGGAGNGGTASGGAGNGGDGGTSGGATSCGPANDIELATSIPQQFRQEVANAGRIDKASYPVYYYTDETAGVNSDPRGLVLERRALKWTPKFGPAAKVV
jgi:hypothetical protein